MLFRSSGRYDIHHGEAVGVLLPYVVKANYSYAEKEYETIKLIFEEKLGQTFRTLSEALDAFYAEIGFDRCALQREVDRTTFCSDFEELICESYNGDMDGNPREMTDDIIGDILNKVFGVS